MTTTYTATELAPETDRLFEDGLDRIRSKVDKHLLMVDGRWEEGQATRLHEQNPARLSEFLGEFACASAADVDRAVLAAQKAQQPWARLPAGHRIELLQGTAAALKARAGEFGAALCLEVGKNRLESMGEVDEVAELIRYYSEQAARGFEIELDSPPGHRNRSVMLPFGVFGVIVPFNFPLALLVGPSLAAMLGGNTVVAKPSPTTSLVAVMFAEALLEAGVPDGVFNLVTGDDETGRALVAHRGLNGMVFTGSYAVGQRITSTFSHDAGFVRPCIVEMGGKNPAIVMSSADLKGAAQGITRSAFSLSGQKCSACSRVLVQWDAHDALVDELISQTKSWTVADPATRYASLGPVHEKAAFERYQRAIEEAKLDGVVVAGGNTAGADLDGYYVEPTVVVRLPVDHRLTREEQFVPLITVEGVDTLDHALERANDQVYGLTAGIFTADESEVDTFLRTIQAGTLFVNRAAGATSGGWPGQQSYAGWKGSGSSSRGALGPRYVEQFLREQGRNIVVNLAANQ